MSAADPRPPATDRQLPDPGFDEARVAAILQRTAELQIARDQERERARGGAAGDDVDAAAGLTLVQLEQIAHEAGIDPALVRRAAADVATRESTPRNWFLGDATSVVVEREVPGELPAAELERMLETVRRVAGDLGDVTVMGRSCGWRGRLDGAKAQAAVSAHDGRTTVRVQVALDEVALGEFMTFTVGAGFTGAFLTFASTVNTLGAGAGLIAGAVAVAGYVAGRLRFQHSAARMRTRATSIADACTDSITSLLRPMLP